LHTCIVFGVFEFKLLFEFYCLNAFIKLEKHLLFTLSPLPQIRPASTPPPQPSQRFGPARPAFLSPRAAADGRDPACHPSRRASRPRRGRARVCLRLGVRAASPPPPPRARSPGHPRRLFKAPPYPARRLTPRRTPTSRRRLTLAPPSPEPRTRRPSTAVEFARGSAAR
jgi:hypothetical protein